ncbi:MAG: PRC-barrel domain-containing protein [Clostridia bacterium]|nr:PRC-barrel domain-containing protein [Clostridia bacterium]
MKKISEIIGLSVICIQEGEERGTIRELLVDSNEGNVKYLVLQDDEWYFGAKILPFTDIQGIGKDAVTTLSKDSIQKLENSDEAVELVKKQVSVVGSKVYTEKGRFIGKVNEYFIDNADGRITGCTAEKHSTDGMLTISSEDIVTYGKKVVIVKDEIESQKEIETQKIEPITADDKEPENIAQDASKLFEMRQIEYFTGKKLNRDILDDDGNIIAKAGTSITGDIIDKTKKAGRFIELTMSIEE